jgi:hypothetical protein
MSAIRGILDRPRIVGIMSFILGLLIGLPLLGWWLLPVEWTDASPDLLHIEAQEDYLRMVIDSYALNSDTVLAQSRYAALGDGAGDILATIQSNPGSQSIEQVYAFSDLVGQPAVAQVEPTGETPSGIDLKNLFIIMCGLTLILAAALFVAYMLRRRREGSEPLSPSPTFPEQDFPIETEEADYGTIEEEAPLGQFMTTYMLGEDLFDDSFSVDSPAGEFLGECGVGIAEQIGVGEPKRVTAFEVWLFDKNDIQTVTKVVMSSHAHTDEAIHERLVAKGEPILAEPGAQITLETATLRLVARVVDMTYGEGALPDQSYFERMTLELAVWTKGI